MFEWHDVQKNTQSLLPKSMQIRIGKLSLQFDELTRLGRHPAVAAQSQNPPYRFR